MNLKESFRYQNFLDRLFEKAMESLIETDHCIKETLVHHMNVVNSDAEDKTEVVEVPEFPENDKVLHFMLDLIDEKRKLTDAIGMAKRNISFDIESAVAANKYRQSLNRAIRIMLNNKAGKSVRRGSAYKFNLEGNQTPYYYEIEVSKEELYDRGNAKAIMRNVIATADEVSSQLDEVMINTKIDYNPPWDVNADFDEIIEEFEK